MNPPTGGSEQSSTPPPFSPGFELDFESLIGPQGPALVDAAFVNWLHTCQPGLARQVDAARTSPDSFDGLALSELLIRIATELDDFIAALFGIDSAVNELRLRHQAADPLLRVKYKFVKRQALLGVPHAKRAALDAPALRTELIALGADPDNELAFADQILSWQTDARGSAALATSAKPALEKAKLYSAWAAGTEAGRIRHHKGVLFDHPQPTDPAQRIEFEQTTSRTTPDRKVFKIHQIAGPARQQRDGFALTDKGTDLNGAMDQAKYCLLCHKTGKDSCSHGLPGVPSEDAVNAPTQYRRSASGESLAGCPLEERISEFLQLKLQGQPIGALAMIVLDNPMVAATGHRICNDCMKSCVYQQQSPVDIPQAETRVLRDVLELPWGFEIYALLTRWNPLRLRSWLPAPATGKRTLIVGAGPAGFTLAHLLLNDGHDVVVIDGLKIEPSTTTTSPVFDINTLKEPLDSRIADGFGGVAEYGITVRWDKNFLRLIRLLLQRRERFALFGGIRFGGAIGTQTAWKLGFDHIALATGAGRPTLLNIPNGLARGVRAASDFLMALQLTGAARADSLANLQMRLPVLVVGGGLTAMDTATEAQAYYPVQVEKFLQRHLAIAARLGEAQAKAAWPEQDRALAQEFLDHAYAIRAERQRATAAGEAADLASLIQSWGGVTVVYRKQLTDSPAYRLNPEEVANALAEGIVIAAGLQPVAVRADESGDTCALLVQSQNAGQASQHELAARSIFVAAGTHPNAVLAREEPHRFALHGDYFAARNDLGELTNAGSSPHDANFCCALEADGRRVSFLGDAHPVYAGNVVSALASAKHAAPWISRVLAAQPAADPSGHADWLARLSQQLGSHVSAVNTLAPGIIEVVVHAPAAVAAFQPGQFYRLQNFERRASIVTPDQVLPTRLGMEGLAMTGAWVDHRAGTVGLIILEMGGSSNLCADLKAGEPVVLMGPTGSPTEIVRGQTVLLVGGGLGNAVLFSIGAALRAAGSTVVYVAAYRRLADRFRAPDIEAAADHVIWCCEQAPGFQASRASDRSFHGNVIDGITAWTNGSLPALSVKPLDVQRLITIGSDAMMAAVANACRGTLKNFLRDDLIAIASINSPMQCMMKEICAQCLQLHRDPDTGQTSMVFSCANQDQCLSQVDFGSLAQRLAQNRLPEAQTAQWLALCLDNGKPA